VYTRRDKDRDSDPSSDWPDLRKLKPMLDAPAWRVADLLERAEMALAMCEVYRKENAELRAQLAVAAAKLFERERRTSASEPEMVLCASCGDPYLTDLISPIDGRCYRCRAASPGAPNKKKKR
jgi:hypothetical protein